MANSKITIAFSVIPSLNQFIKFKVNGVQTTETYKAARTTNFEVLRSGDTVIENMANYISAFNLDYNTTGNFIVNLVIDDDVYISIESTSESVNFSDFESDIIGISYVITNEAFTKPTTLPVENRTAITEEANITFCSSPVHLRLQNSGEDSTIQKATVYLWIWSGDQTKTLGSPNHILVKDKISASDNYINFEISDLLKSYINPLFVYNELSNPAIVNQGVFWQIVTDIESEADIVRNNYNTCFATLGYRWNYEQSFLGDNGVQQGGSLGFVTELNRWYNPRIHNYITQAFNLANSVEEATSANMITVTDIPYNEIWQKCVKDSCLIVYLDKRGLFEMFTPIGKITVNGKIDSQTNNRTFRDPSTVDNSFQHSKLRDNLDVSQSYTINTGMLQEQMVDLVEEIIYSPKVYLIRFKGDVQEATTIGLTIDNTYVTIDDTTITIDSLTVTEEAIGKFKTHQQIPVVVTDSDFQRKTRINDKIMIDYNIKFDETNNKILDIR